MAHMAPDRRDDNARRCNDPLQPILQAEVAQRVRLRGRGASSRLTARASLGLGIPPSLDLGRLAACHMYVCWLVLSSLGLGKLGYLSSANIASDVSWYGRVPRALYKKLFSSP